MPILKSSAIYSAEYNARLNELYIVFVEGDEEYTYYGVPEIVYMDLINASSAGSYFNRYIRDKYSENS